MAYECKVLADSVTEQGARLTTMQVTFPRIVLAEFNTHRMFSRNSASSRAIPIDKMIERVMTDPFLPVWWGKNQKGMQAAEELSTDEQELAEQRWLIARKDAVYHVEELQKIGDSGVHKQIANRLLEPFLWHTVIVTATEWSNFFGLRCHPAAQPEIRRIAEMMRVALQESNPELVKYDPGSACLYAHLPLTPDLDALKEDFTNLSVCKISAARCARVSYLTHNGLRDPSEDLSLAKRLQQSGHMSPFEHVAYPTNDLVVRGNFRGWLQLRKTMPFEDDFSTRPEQT